MALTTPQPLRSTPRPYDEDLDGLLDEDPGNDLNKDGIISDMRVKNPSEVVAMALAELGRCSLLEGFAPVEALAVSRRDFVRKAGIAV